MLVSSYRHCTCAIVVVCICASPLHKVLLHIFCPTHPLLRPRQGENKVSHCKDNVTGAKVDPCLHCHGYLKPITSLVNCLICFNAPTLQWSIDKLSLNHSHLNQGRRIEGRLHTSPWWYADNSATEPASWATLTSRLSFLLKQVKRTFLCPGFRPGIQISKNISIKAERFLMQIIGHYKVSDGNKKRRQRYAKRRVRTYNLR